MSTDYGRKRLAVCASHAPGMARDAEHVQGEVFRAGLARARELVAEFDPELVVMFGVDHVRAFDAVVPAVAVIREASGLGDVGSPVGPYDVPSELAVQLTEQLLARGIDCALTHKAVLDHGFGQTVGDVLGALDAYPIIPVFINCAEPPLMLCSRAAAIGTAVGDILAAQDKRVLFLATGGLSHEPPSLVTSPRGLSEAERREINLNGSIKAREKMNPAWDREFLAHLGSTDRDWLAELDKGLDEVAGCGANEVRTWLAAWASAGQPLEVIVYEPVLEWITGMGVVASQWLAG